MINVVGISDTNSRFNENLLRENAEIRRELNQFVQVDLHIDFVPDWSLSREQAIKEGLRNQEMLARFNQVFTSTAHIVFEFDANQPFKDGLPNGRSLAQHVGIIEDPRAFAQMLRDAAR